MLAIIEAVPRMASRDQLFGTRGNGFIAWSRGKTALDARSGVEELDDARSPPNRRHAHGRSRDRAARHRANFESPVRPQERTGGRLQSKLDYEREVRAALATWHDHLRALIAGGERKVISMPQVAS